MIRTRFAPSPTGHLHLGHAYAAQVAWQLAQSLDGDFLVRFEDIDHTRVRDEFYRSTLDDLKWLGFHPFPEPQSQLDHLEDYQRALEILQTLGVVYPCFCSRRDIQSEIENMPRAPHGPEGPLYPGTCRHLSHAERKAKESTSQPPVWRLDATKAAEITGPLTFSDGRLGTFSVDPHLLGDVILARRDIGTSYHLAVVLDDARQQITHVTRGKDLLSSTHIHRLLQTLLELPEPQYLHHVLVTDDAGHRLAKRDAARSLHQLREQGSSPREILAMLPPMPCFPD